LPHGLPAQISALGITFSRTDQRVLIWMAMVFQIYLVVVFVISATADFLQWRHELRHEIEPYLG
jgi:hypothetical protein